MSELDWLAGRFEENRSRLGAMVYRMLGSHGEAEDAVQETWLRVSRAPISSPSPGEVGSVRHPRQAPEPPCIDWSGVSRSVSRMFHVIDLTRLNKCCRDKRKESARTYLALYPRPSRQARIAR